MPNGTGTFWERFRETSRLAGLALRLMWRASPLVLLGVLLLLVLQALLPLLQLALSKAVIDRIALDLDRAGATDTIAAHLPLAAWIALTAAVLAIGEVARPVSTTLRSMAGDRMTGYLSEQLIHATNRWRGLERFEDPSFADDLQRVRDGAEDFGLVLMVQGTIGVLGFLSTVTFALTLIGLHPLAPLVLLLATLPQAAMMWRYLDHVHSHLYFKTPEARRLEYTRDVLLSPEQAKDVRLYGLGPYFQGRYVDLFARTVGNLDRLRRRLAVQVGLASLFSTVTVGGIYAYTVLLISRGRLTEGDLLLYGGAATMFCSALDDFHMIAAFWPAKFGRELPALDRVLNAPPDLPLPTNPLPIPRPFRQGIVFENVCFTYPGTRNPVLRGVSFAIRPGEGLALAGHNGTGKTTIIKLLMRFYDPTDGRILLDNVELKEYDVDAWRREVGAIFQDFVRYELTARENIGMGQVENLHDEVRIRDAARQGGALDLLGYLPEGLDTRVGRLFGGRELSGGEWQKLALSRAFFRECQLLVLDEPTAALDVQTEYDVYTRFYDLTQGRMTLLISHRFSTIRMADRILYLADGQIREEGTHDELLGRGGEYARLYRLQASQYLDQPSEEAKA